MSLSPTRTRWGQLNVFISISLKEQSKAALSAFESRIAEHDEVMECYLMTGDSDYLIRVVVADIQALERFILEQLTPIPGIEKIRSSFTLKTGALQDGVAALAPPRAVRRGLGIIAAMQKEQLIEWLTAAIRTAGLSDTAVPALERPKQAEHGDWATNIALQMAKPLGKIRVMSRHC